MEKMYCSSVKFSHLNCVPLELEAAFLPKVAEALRQELPVRTRPGKAEMIVGMPTKLWEDWVFSP